MSKENKHNKAIKYRIYPTEEQSVLFAKTFGCRRKVYNLMLADKIKSYKDTGSFGNQTPAMYKKDYPFLKEVDSLALANTQLDLQKAISNACNKKDHYGFPTFKSAKHSRKSYTTNNQNGTIRIGNNAIKLPKAGMVKAIIHRLPEPDWELKSATVSQDSDGKFYISVLFEYETNVQKVPVSDSVIGLDYKSDGLFMDSNGHSPKGEHKYFRQSQKKLAKAQRKLKHKAVGSNNYKKQQLKIAKIHKHISNQRLDYLHNLSTEIANRYDVVCVEDINMVDILHMQPYRNYHKATMDNGYGIFLALLSYKMEDRGKYFIKVARSYPSTEILHCHPEHRVKLAISDRKIVCPVCGCIYDRDYNAAINIKNEGLRMLALAS